MEIIEQTIISVEIDGKRIEFPDKASAAETVNVLKAVGKFLQEGQQVPAARALKKYFESAPKEAAAASKPRKTTRTKKKAAEAAESPAAKVSEKQPEDNNTLEDTDKVETEKPEKATRNILPNPPGFTRPTDPKTGKPQRGRAPNAEKIAWAEQHAGDSEVQAWAKENDVKLPDAKSPATPAAPKPPAPPTSDAKPPAPPVDGFGPPPVGPPPAL